MVTVLIVDPEKDFRRGLIAAFPKEYQILCCDDGITALELLRKQRPDVLILSLFLPGLDGLSLMEQAGTDLPPFILCTTIITTSYVLQAAQDLGANYVILKPCPASAVTSRVSDLLNKKDSPAPSNAGQIVAKIIEELGYPSHRDGYKMLKLGVPLLAQAPDQLLSHQLYPAIGKLCGKSRSCVEAAIRTLTQEAWQNGPREAWESYFPNQKECPTNKQLLSRLVQLLNETQNPPPL